jgi:hypothetical protein
MNMKLTITQIILGTLVFLAAAYIVWWMVAGANELLDSTVLNESGSYVANYTPDNETIFTFSRYASGVLAVLGLVVVATGALWKKAENRNSLTNIQIISGILIIVLSVIILIWGYSFHSIAPFEGGPELTKTYAIALTVLTVLLGLGILSISLTLRKRFKQINNI